MVSKRDTSDEHLVEQFVAGDDAAFEELVRRYYEQVYLFLARFMGQKEVAEDLTQEIFIKVHWSADTFDPTRRFRPWLFAIAANKARDTIRAAGRTVRTVSIQIDRDGETHTLIDKLPAEHTPPAAELIRQETSERVKAIVRTLPDALREVLVLAYYQHLQYKEIAEIVGIPLGTVKSRLHKAVMTFGKMWKSIEHERE